MQHILDTNALLLSLLQSCRSHDEAGTWSSALAGRVTGVVYVADNTLEVQLTDGKSLVVVVSEVGA